MSRSQKERYKMRPPRDIFKPIILVKDKNGAYRQENFKELKGPAGPSVAGPSVAGPKGGKNKRGRKTRRTQKRRVSRRSRTKSRR